ncbi:MAG TPA: DUF2065 domain-containing protein [Nevskiaceae bacterium]|nr:DUF2065 domain-containing protein [Nevskiaceae bacterium]
MDIEWQLLARALALTLVLEGLLPFMAPSRLRQTMLRMAQLDDRVLRTLGLLSMITGIVVLQLL